MEIFTFMRVLKGNMRVLKEIPKSLCSTLSQAYRTLKELKNINFSSCLLFVNSTYLLDISNPSDFFYLFFSIMFSNDIYIDTISTLKILLIYFKILTISIYPKT